MNFQSKKFSLGQVLTRNSIISIYRICIRVFDSKIKLMARRLQKNSKPNYSQKCKFWACSIWKIFHTRYNNKILNFWISIEEISTWASTDKKLDHIKLQDMHTCIQLQNKIEGKRSAKKFPAQLFPTNENFEHTLFGRSATQDIITKS